MNYKYLLLISILLMPMAFARTLIISDSHSTGAFGKQLAKLFEQDDFYIDYYAFGGSKPIDWIQGNNLTWGYWEHHSYESSFRGTHRPVPILTELIKEHQPKEILIIQGTNTVWYPETNTDIEAIRFLIRAVHAQNAKCIWIGPPDLIPQTEDQRKNIQTFHERIQKETSELGCELIKSWEITRYPIGLGDGIHYDQIPGIGKKIAREWAQNVYSIIRQNQFITAQ